MKPTETLALYGLAGVGAGLGVAKYYPSELAWGVLAASIITYDVLCPNGQTLSEGVDRALESHKVLTLAAIGVTALHLANLLPDSIDPFSHIVKKVKKYETALS